MLNWKLTPLNMVEDGNDNWDTIDSKVREFVRDILEITVNDDLIQRTHRLGKKQQRKIRLIICKLLSNRETYILKHSEKLGAQMFTLSTTLRIKCVLNVIDSDITLIKLCLFAIQILGYQRGKAYTYPCRTLGDSVAVT